MTPDAYPRRLTERLAERGRLCVGIDPHPGLLRAWGLSTDAAGVERFARTVVDSVGTEVAVFKPQSAFFETYGSAGIAVLERVLADLRDAGACSLLDVKRGDIGSTMDAYAAAYLTDGAPLAADAITLSPYLGFGSLDGAIELARSTGRGVYVLALTSNPEAPAVQHARTADDKTIGQSIIDQAAARNAGDELGHVGVVVGATIESRAGEPRSGGPAAVDFSRLNGSILVPGLGFQGAKAEDLEGVFGTARDLVLPSMSREILRAGPDPDALRTAVRAAQAAVNDVICVG
jgi:orotidine-5'-phosphate decarboxylase